MTRLQEMETVHREVRDVEHEGRPGRAVVIERPYATTVEDLWDALTNPERLPRWFLPVEGDLRLGGRYALQGNASGEVTECEPPTHFAATWEFNGATSWIDVRLEADGDGARLRLEHIALLDDQEMWLRYGPGAVGVGWDLALFGLAEHLRTGEAVTVDPEAALGGEGQAMITRSSDGWGEASIAYGTPEDAARLAAARTLAFYTGTEEPESDAEPAGGGEKGPDPT